jgi:hypothetical protein
VVTDRSYEVVDLVVLFKGVAKGNVGANDVVVSATLLDAFNASDRLEVGEDLRRGALGDVDAFGDVFEPEVRRRGDSEEHVSVIGEKRPVPFSSHAWRLPETSENKYQYCIS